MTLPATRQDEDGAGKTTVWDRGTYLSRCSGDDRITFQLLGDRLAGTYTVTLSVRAGPDPCLLSKHKA